MRTTVIILFCFFFHNVFAQNYETPNPLSELYKVELKDTILDNKIVIYDIGNKSRVFLSLNLLMITAKELSTNYNKRNYNKVIKYLKKESLKNDTIIINDYSLGLFDYMVERLLQNGNAKVFYKKLNIFVPVIYHRQERYAQFISTYFYLPDFRTFFSIVDTTLNYKELHYDTSEELKIWGHRLKELRDE